MKTFSEENFQPDYRNLLQVLNNQRPQRLPLYEHHIDLPFISKVLGKPLALQGNQPQDYVAHYREVIGFWRDMTYGAFYFQRGNCGSFPLPRGNFGGGCAT